MMASESKPIPPIAKSAVKLAEADHRRTVNALAAQTLEVMQLDPSEGWRVDVTAGVAFREVKDEQPGPKLEETA